MSLEMRGLDPNTVFARVRVPGFWLLKAEKAIAVVYPTLYWKCIRPTGNTNTSPAWSIFVMRRFSGLEVTKPTWRLPSRTVKISVARGCVCGGLTPWRKSYTRNGYTKRVESWNLVYPNGGHMWTEWIWCVACLVKSTIEEVIGFNSTRVLADKAIHWSWN